jgi:hypothetical protein
MDKKIIGENISYCNKEVAKAYFTIKKAIERYSLPNIGLTTVSGKKSY